MLYEYFKRENFSKPGQGNAGEAAAKRHSGMKLAGVFILLLALVLVLSSAIFGAESDPIYIGFTSDVHGSTASLTTWLSNLNLESDVPTLDRMIFGGDYPDRANESSSWTVAQQCVDIVQTAYGSSTPCVLVRGNHDTKFDTFDKGLIYNGDDYAVYAMDSSSWSFLDSDISDLAVKLDSIDASKPVFVASHCPIHYYFSSTYGGRTTGNADALLTVLNQHENVIFFWGHNHTVNDPYYGDVMTKGFKIKTTSSGSEQAINFTYLSYGSMLDGNNGAYGLLAALTEDGNDTRIIFDYKNLSGETASSGSVTIEGDASSGDIDRVALTGITVPNTGEIPDTTATTSSYKYTLSPVSWNPADNPFAADTTYTASVTLSAAAGYNFTESTRATINGNNAMSITLNGDGTLTVTYTFPKTSSVSGTTYQLANSLESGKSYVIVAKSSSGNYYALTNATASSNFLAATPVTVQGNEVMASSVTDAMLWTAETASKYMYLKNDGGYLQRVSGSAGQLNASSSVPGEGYGEWLYYNSGSKLYTISTSSGGSGSEFVLFYKSGSPSYFKAEYNGTSAIHLYKLIQGTPGEDQPLNSVTITGITAPVAGATPVTTALVGDSFYTASAVSWSPAVSGSFCYDTVYTASVTLSADSGYVFDSGVTVTVNGNAATSKTLNPDGTLTVTYAFPKTSFVSGTTYQLVNSLEAGETYVIVTESSGNYYALTNTTASSNFLAATSVTVQGNEVMASSVTDAMLWTAETASKYMYLKNDGGYLQRVSGSAGQLNASSSVPGEGYGEWCYENDENKLYTISTSSQGSGSEFVLFYKSDSPSYFQAKYQGTNTIYLYKLIQSTPATQYTLTLIGDNISSVPAAGFIDKNTEVTITVAPATGQQVVTFAVGGVDKKSELASNQYTFTISADTEVAVTYEAIPETYVVIFNSNCGSEVEAQTVNCGGTATEPAAPTKEGYSFAGWYADEELTTAFDFNMQIEADTTVYARWEINIYTLIYAAGENGSITGTATQTVEYRSNGTAVKAVAAEGYHFVSWSDSSTANPRTDINVTSNITVTASFAINEYTVDFKDWDDSVIDTQTVAHGSAAMAPEDPAREGYTFSGWDTGFSNVTSNLTVIAKYTINTYTVTFESNGGSEVTPITGVEKGTTVDLPAGPTRDGYVFDGWFIDKDLMIKFTAETEITANITVYAKWSADLTLSINELVVEAGRSVLVRAYMMRPDGRMTDVTLRANWASADTSTATVSRGTVKGLRCGETKITVTYDGHSASLEVTVCPLLTGLSAAEPLVNMEKGTSREVVQIIASYRGADSVNVTADCKWTSAKPQIADVAENGRITAVSPGQATITAVYGSKLVRITVNVIPVVVDLVVTPESAFIEAGRTVNVRVAARYEGNYRDTTVTTLAKWSSADERIATFSRGQIQAVECGETTLTVTYGKISKQIPVSVIPAIRSLVADNSQLTIVVESSACVDITANYRVSSYEPELVTGDCTWSSSNQRVATVENGCITAVSPGRTTVTAAYGSKQVKITVNVIPVVANLVVTPESVFIEAGRTVSVRVVARYVGNCRDATVTTQAGWTSADESIATVSSGRIRAVGCGETTLTVTYGEKSEQIPVTVIPAIRSLVVENSRVTINMGSPATVETRAIYSVSSYASEIVTGNCTWSSRNQRVVTVDENGLITPVAPGKTSVTARYGSRSVTISVTVVP